MNRLAVFGEGHTEIVFVDKLIEDIAGQNRVLIEHRTIRGGTRVPRRTITIKAAKPATGQQYFVLLVDCGGDESVKTRIREEHVNLTRLGYSKIIGLRDVRPTFTYAEIPRLEAGLPTYIDPSLIPVTFILAIMEIEAWFLAETTHFQRIDPSITVAAIKATLGFDPANDDMEQRLTPAVDLNNCYRIGGKTYAKHQAQLTVDALDYASIYMEVLNKFTYLKRLIDDINAFLT